MAAAPDDDAEAIDLGPGLPSGETGGPVPHERPMRQIVESRRAAQRMADEIERDLRKGRDK
jgi:hypothetical protein